MKRIRKIVLAIMTAVMIGLAAAPVSVGAYTCDSGSARVKSGGDANVTSPAECAQPKEDREAGDVITKIINVVIGVLGIVAVLVLIIGGLIYITSAGDPGKVAKAKNVVMYAIIGLTVATLAWAIVNFVLASVFSGNK